MPKMKNVAKNEIVLHDPYSNALCPPPLLLAEKNRYVVLDGASLDCYDY